MGRAGPDGRRHQGLKVGWELLIVLSVAGYSLLVLIGAREYRLDARLFPYVVGGIALAVSVIYLIRMALRPVLPPTEPDRASAPLPFRGAITNDGAVTDEVATDHDGDDAGRVPSEPVDVQPDATDAPRLRTGPPPRQWDMWLIVGISLVVLVIAGRYAFALALPAMFMRRLGRHGWITTVLASAGLVAFTWVLTTYLVRARLPSEFGLLGRLL